jgi:hypothetical protein
MRIYQDGGVRVPASGVETTPPPSCEFGVGIVLNPDILSYKFTFEPYPVIPSKNRFAR